MVTFTPQTWLQQATFGCRGPQAAPAGAQPPPLLAGARQPFAPQTHPSKQHALAGAHSMLSGGQVHSLFALQTEPARQHSVPHFTGRAAGQMQVVLASQVIEESQHLAPQARGRSAAHGA